MPGRGRGRPPHPDVLTPAEQRVLDELRRGGTNAEIAVRLGLSPDTVKSHVASMLGKLDLDDRHALAAWRPDRERLEIDRVAWAAWQEQEEAAGRRGVGFEVVGAGEAAGDEAAVYQIFRNLFENSLRYVPEDGGRIVVEIASRGGQVVVAVRDNGAGIPAASLPRIFERFYRVDTARSRREGGTGLGLAIVRHLVSSMGGEVSAESAWGSGTTITFSVPVHRRATAEVVAT